MNEKVIIIGAGGHAKVVADIVRKRGDEVLGFLDDDENKRGASFFGSTVLGGIAEYEKYSLYACFIIAIGNNSVRKRIAEQLKCRWYSAIHPSAVIAEGVNIGEGSFVGALAVINPDTQIGNHAIINTCAVVEHDCSIGDFTHISPSTTVCGGVTVGNLCWIGAGATVINSLSICDGATVGAGAAVIRDITEGGTYVGVPVKKI